MTTGSIPRSVTLAAHLAACALALFGVALALVALPASARAAAGSDRLASGESLAAGQSIAGGGDALVMQGDGNLVLYAAQGVPLWASGSSGHAGAWAVMQSDGNLVVYTSTGVKLWASGTNGRGPSTLVMQGDGNLVVYAGSTATWSSNTYRQSYAVNRFSNYGWAANQWSCLNQLWTRESRWNELARNFQSGAYGIPQALPANKMAVDGSDYLTNPFTQIHWGEDYISREYHTPCGAWSHETAYGWY